MARIPGNLLERFSSRTALAASAIGGAGLVAGFASGNPINYAINSETDALYDDPNIDNNILGRDLRIRDFFPIGPNLMEGLTGNRMRLRDINATTLGLASTDVSDVARRTAASNYTAQSSYRRGSIYPTKQVRRSGAYATGDVVLGSYNLRHG